MAFVQISYIPQFKKKKLLPMCGVVDGCKYISLREAYNNPLKKKEN